MSGMDTDDWVELRAWIADRRAKVMADRAACERACDDGKMLRMRWYDGHASALALVLNHMQAMEQASEPAGDLLRAGREHGA